MTTKEKAKELFDKFKDLTLNVEYDDEQNNFTAKECALIAVDEIIDAIKKNSTEFRGCMDFQLIACYEDVKQEIINL